MAADDLDSMRVLKDWTCLLSCGIIILTLGSHGLYLPALKFWVCWSLLMFDAIMFYAARPYWIWIEKSLIVMIFRDHDFSQRQNKILLFISLSTIIIEGFLNIAIIRDKKENYVPNQIIKMLPMISSIKKQNFDWNAATLLIPSAISVMICVTGAIVLGGRLGIMLCDKLYWILIFLLAVDFMAEFINRFDCGKRSLFDPISQPLPKRRYFANILRVSVEGLLCYSMIVQISGNPYYVDVKICGARCQDRSRSMLMTMAALSGIQATVAFFIPLCSCLLCIFTGKRETEVKNRCQC